MENRHGLIVDACVVPATGTGERDAATSLIAALPHRRVTNRRRQRLRKPLYQLKCFQQDRVTPADMFYGRPAAILARWARIKQRTLQQRNGRTYTCRITRPFAPKCLFETALNGLTSADDVQLKATRMP